MNQQEIIAAAVNHITFARSELTSAERTLLLPPDSRSAIPPPQREPPKRDELPPHRPPARPRWQPLRLPYVNWERGEVHSVVNPGMGKNAIGLAIQKCISDGGGTVLVEKGEYGEQKVTWGEKYADFGRISNPPGWDALETATTQCKVICEEGTTFAGIQVHGGGYDMLIVGAGITWVQGASTAIGSTGGPIALRMHKCYGLQSKQDPKPIKWFMRPYGIFLHLDDCDFSAVASVEHGCYLDTCWGIVINKTKFGPAGRTHAQWGTRVENAELYYLSSRWPGVMIQDCEGLGLNSGVGGGSGLTCWGYPGPVQINGWHMTSNAPEYVMVGTPPVKVNMNENRCFSIWRATNYKGVILPPAGEPYATPFVSIDNVTCDYTSMNRPLGEIESAGEVWLGRISGDVRKPWIDSPDSWPSGPVGSIRWIPGNYARIEVRDNGK